MKKFILNADDLAKSEFHNTALKNAFLKGLLKSTSIMANMPLFDETIKEFSKLEGLSIGVHLNLIEGYAINKNLKELTDNDGKFKNGYLNLILKSNSNKFLKEVEIEFRSQIEAVLKYITPTHIDSHVHTHGIPNIFNLVLKLAEEYKITNIRTQAEIPYFINDLKTYNLKTYLINLIKVVLLNYFTLINKSTLKKYNLKTNDYLLGVSYSAMMDKNTIIEGLEKINKLNKGNILVEALIHPCLYNDNKKDSHLKEFESAIDDNLIKEIISLGYSIEKW